MIVNLFNMSVFAFLVLATPLVYADPSAPSHACHSPGKASEIKTQPDADKFNDTVDKYRSCIEGFIRQQDEAIKNHQRALSQATSDWNDLVTNNMKQ